MHVLISSVLSAYIVVGDILTNSVRAARKSVQRRVLVYASKRFEKQAHDASASMRSLSTPQMGLYRQPGEPGDGMQENMAKTRIYISRQREIR